MIKDTLSKTIIDFKFSETEYNRLINKIKMSIKENWHVIRDAQKIDSKYYNYNIKEIELLEIVEIHRNSKIENEKKLETLFIEYRGNPQMTLKLCIEAVLKKKKIIIDSNDFMFAVNTVIVQIMNEELKKYGIVDLITLCNLMPYEEIINNNKKIDRILVIDMPDVFNDLKLLNIEHIYEKKFFYVDVYCDNDELIELRELLCDFADLNNIPIEIWDDCKKEEVANTIEKYSMGNIVVLLSKDEKLQEQFKKTIKIKKLFINKNIFQERNVNFIANFNI